jgi:hypothetical protein
MGRLEDLERFYRILGKLEESLGGKFRLADCHGRMEWPERGVYFFFEEGELRSDSGQGMRVVRVGTHALTAGSRTTLWNRLSQHRGTQRHGTGNHRGSIFRLLVGAAIKAQDNTTEPVTWGVASDPGAAAKKLGTDRQAVKAGEVDLERRVSIHIGAMPFLWVAAEDVPGRDSARGFIERNAIALLSDLGKTPLDESSPGWLGRYSDRLRVRESGLWNNNHVEEDYDASFLDVLEGCVKTTSIS